MERRRYLASTAVLGAGCLAGCVGGPLAPTGGTDLTVDGDWRQPGGGPGHTRATQGPGPGDSLASRWRYSSSGEEYLVPRAVADGTLFALSDQRLVALNATDGTEQWAVTADALRPSGSAGQRAHSAKRPSNTPVLVGPDRVYLRRGWFPRDPGTDAPTLRRYPATNDGVGQLRLTGDALVYTAGHQIVSVPLGADEPKWTTEIDEAEGLGDVAPGNLLVTGDVVVATKGGRTWGFDLADGTQMWRQPDAFEEDSWIDQLAARPGRVYGITYGEERLRALDATTGEQLWTYDHGYPAFVAASDEHVVLGGTPANVEKRGVQVLDPAGDRRWATEMDYNDVTYGPPIVAADVVYTSPGSSTITAYDAASGAEHWALSKSAIGKLTSGFFNFEHPIVAGEGLFVGEGGDLYGFGPA